MYMAENPPIYIGGFSAIYTWEMTMWLTVLLSCTTNPVWKEVYAKRKEFAPKGSKFFPFRVDPFLERRKKQSDRVATPESVSIRLKFYVFVFCSQNFYPKIKFTAKIWSDLCNFYRKVIFFWSFWLRKYFLLFFSEFSQQYFENFRIMEQAELVENLPPSYLL